MRALVQRQLIEIDDAAVRSSGLLQRLQQDVADDEAVPLPLAPAALRAWMSADAPVASVETALDTINAAHFLEADTAPHAARFWRTAAAAPCATPTVDAASDASTALQLLSDAPSDVCVAAFAAHPAVTDTAQPLATKLSLLPSAPPQLAAAAAAAAAATCLQTAVAGPTLPVNAGAADACARLEAALPLVPSLAAVALYVPADGGDIVQGRARNSRATAERFLTRVAALPSVALTSLHAATPSVTSSDKSGGALGRLLRLAGTQLQRLALCQAPISWGVTKRHLVPHLTALSGSLRELELRDCALGPTGAAELAAPLATLACLTRLCLSGNAIKRKGAAALARLSTLTGLSSLDLSANKLCRDGVPPVVTIITPLMRLTSLHLGWNWLRGDGAIALAPLLAQMQGLARLNLAWSVLGISGARRLFGHITCLSALQSLDVSDNDLYDRGAQSLGNALRCFPFLTHLALSGNFIGADGAESLAPKLLAATALQHLDLKSNLLGDEGVSVLVAHVSMLAQLTMLDLSDNEVGWDAARAETDKLRVLPALQHRGLCQRPRRRDLR